MINFLRFRLIFFFLSATIILIGLFSIFRWGFRFSVDFTGGTTVEFEADKIIPRQEVEKLLNQDNVNFIFLQVNKKTIRLTTKETDNNRLNQLKKKIEDSLRTKLITQRLETVGPTISQEIIRKTCLASVLALGGILLYVSFAFRSFNFALAAILAMIHDFLILLGAYSLISHFFGAEIDPLFVTAMLTTMSFSVHDTIVIFDKIRESIKKEPEIEIEIIANRALTQTVIRSLNNSMTIIFILLSLILLGGQTIKFFVLALLIGAITGTYSSPFIATPLLVWLEKRKRR
ncbi:MAG: protein translocase subunit SecF [Patescibacteria group bacterium]|nr:protein translocase subunit SecF [Patescibacteria group bacterium]